jgi:hypothetical protein
LCHKNYVLIGYWLVKVLFERNKIAVLFFNKGRSELTPYCSPNDFYWQEWGDRSMLATIALGAAQVCFGLGNRMHMYNLV